MLTNLTMIPKMPIVKAGSFGKKIIQFVTKPTVKSTANTTAVNTSVWKPIPIIGAIDVQEEDEYDVISANDTLL